jgi:hypothetical protein
MLTANIETAKWAGRGTDATLERWCLTSATVLLVASSSALAEHYLLNCARRYGSDKCE